MYPAQGHQALKGRVGFTVGTMEEMDILVGVPLDQLLHLAMEVSGK